MKEEKSKRSLKKGLIYLLVPAMAFSALSGIKGTNRIFDNEKDRTEYMMEHGSGLEKTLENTSEMHFIETLKDRKEFMKHILNFELDNYSLNKKEKKTFKLMVNNKITDYLTRLNETSNKTGYPEELLGGKMFKESGGNKNAYNKKSSATGLLQIKPSTYASTKNRINWDIEQLKKYLPKEKLDELSKKSMIEQMMLDPEKEKIDFSELIKKMGGKSREHEFYLQRLPVALMVYSEFNGKVPYNGKSPESTLRNPLLNIDASAIIGTDYALWLYAYQRKLEEKEFTPGKLPESKLTVEAILNSYIAGIGDSQKRLRKLYSENNSVTTEDISKYFTKNVFNAAKHYNEKVQAAAIEFKNFLRMKESSEKEIKVEAKPLEIQAIEKYGLIN